VRRIALLGGSILTLTLVAISFLLWLGPLVGRWWRARLYRQADARARALGWSDYRAMVAWQEESERRTAQLRAEARDV
jgi:hypothetical protein